MSKRYRHFSKTDRQELFILRGKGYSLREIGSTLKKSPSSVSRELRRNQVKGEYIPSKAEQKRYVRRKQSKVYGNKIASDTKLRLYVLSKMKYEKWTPEMIHLRLTYVGEASLGGKRELSIKTIYNYIHQHPYGYELSEYLTYRQAKRSKKAKRKGKHIIPDMISVHERDRFYPELKEKRIFGHYEADTLGAIKTDTSRITGVIEKKSRYLELRKVSRLKASMNEGFIPILRKHQNYSLGKVVSTTFDRGIENLAHKKIQLIGIKTYFCEAYTSYQKPQIEQRFQKLRRFIRKGSSIENISHKELQNIQDLLNNMPMRCLGGKTPSEVFKEHTTLHLRE